MPRKSSTETASEAKTMEETNAYTGKEQANEDVKLSAEEKTALEIQQTATEGGTFSGKFKLKDEETSYSDPDFTLAGDQAKELPKNPSTDLIARIRSGFIVKA